jgi:regulator of sigma D
MASTSPSAIAQWQRIETLVKAWLDERQQLIVLLCTLQGIRGLGSGLPQHTQLQQFCQLLMDYISAGYFEVYRELVNEARHFHRENPSLTQHILRQLDNSTDEALAFNADFDNPAHIAEHQDQLPQRISHLMQSLEERFALEDQLILSIHQQEPPLRQAMH